MNLTALGRVNVTAPGTPVPLSTDPTFRVAKLFFQSTPGITGKCYIGAAQLNKTTLAKVIRVLVPAAAGAIADQYTLSTEDGRDGIYLSQYAVDADNAGEGPLVSYWQE